MFLLSDQLADVPVRIPLSSGGYTYAFLPQDFLRGLYGFYGMDLPTELTKPDLTSLSYQNDTIPSNIDPSTISYVSECLSAPFAFPVPNLRTAAGFPDNGRSIISATRDPPFDDRRWVTVTTYFIRVSTDFTPSGRFPVYSNNSWAGRRIGYDAGVCLEMWEPWIVETYNASVVSTSALRIVGRGDGSTLLSPSGNIRGAPIANTRYLNRTRKHDVFWQGFMNSNVRMGEGYDLGRTYSPSPGVGPCFPPYNIPSNPDLPHRSCLSPKALVLMDTLNSPQIDSPLPAHGFLRLMLYHILWGQGP